MGSVPGPSQPWVLATPDSLVSSPSPSPPAVRRPPSAPLRDPLPRGLSSHTTVFWGGYGGCLMYRTPSLVLLNSGELLAFTQCRQDVEAGKDRVTDRSPQEIHLKRSKDHGRTWSLAKTLAFSADPERNRLHRAQTVYDVKTGTIFLFDNDVPTPSEEEHRDLLDGGVNASVANCSVHIWRSDDDGVSWRTVVNTTASSQMGAGLATGIQLPNGRLVVPHKGCNYPTGGQWDAPTSDSPASSPAFVGAHSLWSDDHGATWVAGDPTPPTVAGYPATECQVAPLANGSLLMMARSVQPKLGRVPSIAWQTGQKPDCPGCQDPLGASLGWLNRVSSVSNDEGRTWSVPRVEPSLAGYASCHGSLFRHKESVYFSFPENPRRANLTIRRSSDNGDSWPADAAHELTVHQGPSAYSSLGATALGELAVLWEAWPDMMFATTKYFDGFEEAH